MRRVAGALSTTLWAGPALACSYIPWEPHETAPDPLDEAPPAQVREVSVDVHRGAPRDDGGCEGSTNSCAGVDTVTLHIVAPADDRTRPGRMGYRIELVEGELPGGMQLPEEPVRPLADAIVLGWGDGDEALSFSLRLVPVDAAGREGPPSAPIEIQNAAPDEGCSAVRGTSAAPLWLLVLGLGLRRLASRSRATSS